MSGRCNAGRRTWGNFDSWRVVRTHVAELPDSHNGMQTGWFKSVLRNPEGERMPSIGTSYVELRGATRQAANA